MLLGEVWRGERDNGQRSDVETVGKWMAKEKVLNLQTYNLNLQKYAYACTLWTVLDSRGNVTKCTSAIFFPTEDIPKIPQQSDIAMLWMVYLRD